MKTVFRLFLCLLTVGLVAGASEPDGKKTPAAEKQPKVIDGWGTIVDPDGDCLVRGDKDRLTITVPDTLHSLNTAISVNAPRVLREVEGDFTIDVKVTGDFKPGGQATKSNGYPFNGAGLVIWSDEKNYVRLERNIWWIPDDHQYASYTPLCEYYKGGEEQDPRTGTTDPFFEGNSTWFRLERKGDKVIAFYSHDGKEFVEAREIDVELPKKVNVGVDAINSSNKAFTVEFTELKVVAGKEL